MLYIQSFPLQPFDISCSFQNVDKVAFTDLFNIWSPWNTYITHFKPLPWFQQYRFLLVFLWTHCRPYAWFLQSSLSFPNILSSYVCFLSLIHRLFYVSFIPSQTHVFPSDFQNWHSRLCITVITFTNWSFVATVGQVSVLMTFF